MARRYDRGLFQCVTEPCLCPVCLRNAAVPGDRGALCGPYVTTGCLEAAHNAEASDGTPPTRTTDGQKSSRALKSVFLYGPAALEAERSQDFRWPDSCRAQAEDSMRVRVCPRWGTSPAETVRGGVVSLYSCARARRVKSCRGSRAHTLRPWALSHTLTTRPRRLGLGLGPRALGSHTHNWYFMPRWDAFSVSPPELRVAGRSTESRNQRRRW